MVDSSKKKCTSYRNTSISNVEMTPLRKMGLFTQVTSIALLSYWSPLNDLWTLRKGWGTRRRTSKQTHTLSFLQTKFKEITSTPRHYIELTHNAPQNWFSEASQKPPHPSAGLWRARPHWHHYKALLETSVSQASCVLRRPAFHHSDAMASPGLGRTSDSP